MAWLRISLPGVVRTDSPPPSKGGDPELIPCADLNLLTQVVYTNLQWCGRRPAGLRHPILLNPDRRMEGNGALGVSPESTLPTRKLSSPSQLRRLCAACQVVAAQHHVLGWSGYWLPCCWREEVVP